MPRQGRHDVEVSYTRRKPEEGSKNKIVKTGQACWRAATRRKPEEGIIKKTAMTGHAC